jgi:ABC-type bacteriocin/lantibiotic exporter with double-glycine peptidase domain
MKTFTILLLIAILSSCATIQDRTLETPSEILIKNVPFYPQEDYQCGPSSLASVLNFWGIAVTPERIVRDVSLEKARGTLTIDLIIYALGRGFDAKDYRGNIDDLKSTISKGYPLIVLIDYGVAFYQANHFMVVIGYNPQGVIAHSGRQQAKLIPYDDFLKAWKKGNYWSLLIKPRMS